MKEKWQVIEKETRIIVLEPRPEKQNYDKKISMYIQIPKKGKQRLTVEITNEIEILEEEVKP